MQDSKRGTDIKNRILTLEEGKGGMIWENSIETCILLCVKYMTNLSLMPETGHSKLVHWDNSEGWMGWGGRWQGSSRWGTHVHPWLIHVNVWQKPRQCCKLI